jgi:hypothetical protein
LCVPPHVAELYGVETRRINEAVKNNPEKFPKDYLFEVNKQEKSELVENFDQFKGLKHSAVPVKGFTEKRIYMLATILKSPKAVETTLAIIDTFAKVKELGRAIHQMQTSPENSPKQKTMMAQLHNVVKSFVRFSNLLIYRSFFQTQNLENFKHSLNFKHSKALKNIAFFISAKLLTPLCNWILPC